MRTNLKQSGITVVETLIAVAIFAIVAVGFVQIYARILVSTNTLRLRNIATFIATTEFEIIRNLPYASVGVVGGVPNGILPDKKVVNYNGITFVITPTIRNYDDPFDGTISGNPEDLSPADAKLVELSIDCTVCDNFNPVVYTTRISPLNLETTSTNGSLRIKVFDAAGLPVVGADVIVTNQNLDPAIQITDTTDNNGELLIVDAIPGVEMYKITVTKSGYSTERTYAAGEAGIVTLVKPHSTIALQQLTHASFAIDRTSTLNISSVTDTCSAIGSVDYQLSGSKRIGLDPDVYKYTHDGITNISGLETLTDIEWDTYSFIEDDATYALIGTNPMGPLVVDPNTSQDLQLVVTTGSPSVALVGVTDQASGLPLDGATVRLFSTASYDKSLVTSRGYWRQTDWSGGSGQSSWSNPNRFYAESNINISGPAGEIKIDEVFGSYLNSGWLESSTFDLGSGTNMLEIIWEPEGQPVETGSDSVQFQIASNNDDSTWDFKGPDGTSGTYYSLANQTINSVHSGDQYVRYKVFLSTTDSDYTPNVSDIALTFSSSCTPAGQVAFTGLTKGTYILEVSAPGYVSVQQEFELIADWQMVTIPLSL